MITDLRIADKTVLAPLIPLAGIDGHWLTVDACAAAGFDLVETETEENGVAFRSLSILNRSGRTIHFDGFRWAKGEGRTEGFFSVPGAAMQVYLEGWTMATPCGPRSYGDTDFDFDPSYLPFAVNAPEEYDGVTPNRFRAEYMIMLHDKRSGESLLAGFVSSHRQSGRFRLELAESGVSMFEATAGADGIEMDTGERLSSETLAFLIGKDANALQETFAGLWGRNMNARVSKGASPRGWCSWYYYQENISEDDIRENVEFFARNRDRFPVEYIQMDDGYQRALGDWFDYRDEFPGGIEGVARMILEHGFRPAIWFGPFMVEEESKMLKEHPDWLIHDREGKIIFPFGWRKGHRVACLDGTHPEVQKHFREMFRTVRKMGFEYIKLDFMILGQGVSGSVFYDRKATRLEAMRRGLTAIREGFGEDGFILGCTAPFAGVVGLVDGERISTDIINAWQLEEVCHSEAPTVPNVCRNVCRHGYMHRRLWLNDPDTLIVREDNTALTELETRLWCDAVKLAGGLLLLGDKLTTLSKHRQLWAQKLIAEHDQWHVRPADVFGPVYPPVWVARNQITGEKATGYFNFDKTPVRLSDGTLLAAHSSLIVNGRGC